MHALINGLTRGLRRYADDWDGPRQRAPSARKLKMSAHIRSCVEKKKNLNAAFSPWKTARSADCGILKSSMLWGQGCRDHPLGPQHTPRLPGPAAALPGSLSVPPPPPPPAPGR